MSSDWNELEARWNNRIVLRESPCFRDHKVNDSYIYPAAGMLVMAIEAMRQLSHGGGLSQISGYRFRDVTFSKAIVLSDGPQGTETQFIVRQNFHNSSKQGGWNEFRLCVYEGKQWIECCRGAISTEYKEEPSNSTWIDENNLILQRAMRKFERGCVECKITIDARKAYETFKKSGIDYGPSF